MTLIFKALSFGKAFSPSVEQLQVKAGKTMVVLCGGKA
jgi:hypothetical protein